ncbi:MAG: zf-HC2 domain-containing protein [Acidobacteriota bacterium]|nr:zf-HC2 domain-containing protein [Acidobacteriota bacterium]
MQCREFNEISEAYLSDELLVETNIQVFRHLENCPKCREQFAAKRELRNKVCAAVKRTPEFQINPAFATRLSANLKQTALRESGWQKFLFAPKLLIPVMASLLIFAALGFVFLSSPNNQPPQLAQSQKTLIDGLTEIALKAAGNHEDCALENMPMWEKMAERDYAEKAVYTEKVAKPLQAKFSDKIEMLHAHDCIFEGKEFTHVILRRGTQIVSVFFDKSDVLPEVNTATNASIICEKEKGFQVASFQHKNQAIFVVSEMSETENLSVARALSDSFAA